MQKRCLNAPYPHNMPSKQIASVGLYWKEIKRRRSSIKHFFHSWNLSDEWAKKIHMYIKGKKDHGGPRHLNLSLQWWQQAFKMSFLSLDTLSPFLTQRKNSLPCYSVLSRFPLDRKWKKKTLWTFSPISPSLSVFQPSLFSDFEMPTLFSSFFSSFIDWGSV